MLRSSWDLPHVSCGWWQSMCCKCIIQLHKVLGIISQLPVYLIRSIKKKKNTLVVLSKNENLRSKKSYLRSRIRHKVYDPFSPALIDWTWSKAPSLECCSQHCSKMKRVAMEAVFKMSLQKQKNPTNVLLIKIWHSKTVQKTADFSVNMMSLRKEARDECRMLRALI